MSTQPLNFWSGPKHSFVSVLRAEWKWWAPGSILTVLMASVLLSGWPSGLHPNLEYPYTYGQDGLSNSWVIQRLIEGNLSENARSGYPFGSSMMDYPNSDAGNFMLLKLFGAATGNWFIAYNLFVLASFGLTFVASFCCLRAIGIEQPLAAAAALLFCVLPFQFLRLNHLLLLSCFVVPAYYYCGFYFWRNKQTSVFTQSKRRQLVLILLAALALSCFGVYYALFGAILLATVAAMIAFATANFVRTLPATLGIVAVCVGVLLNVSPHLVHRTLNARNYEVAERQPRESEIYGLRLIQMLLPRPNHRVPKLAEAAEVYARDFPLITENSTACTGLLGSAGLAILGTALLASLAGRRSDSNLTLLAAIVAVFFLTGTIGGLGSLFAATVTPIIRAWNRISVFISFGALTAFFVTVQWLLHRYCKTSYRTPATFAVGLLSMFLGIFDQTAPANLAANQRTRDEFIMDRDFVLAIERQLPSGSAIYQLPYLGCPETPLLNGLNTYNLLTGFLQSQRLRWSHGGMKGRAGDLFYRRLSQEPLEKQLAVIRELGFAGVYIDRRGYADNANQIIRRLSILLNEEPSLQRKDGEIVFFRISPGSRHDFSNLNTGEVLATASRIAGYSLPPRQQVTYKSPSLSFGKWSYPETSFRWTEGKECSVGFVLDEPVEDLSRLIVKGAPLGAQRLALKLNGKNIYSGKIDGGPQTLEIDLPRQVLARGDNQLIFQLPDARAPGNGDPRLLGFALESLGLE